MVDEWAQEKAKEVKLRRQAEEQKRQAQNDEQKRKEAQAPLMWEEFTKALKTSYDNLLEALGEPNSLKWISDGSNSIVIKTKENFDFVSARYEPTRLQLSLSLIGAVENYKVGLDGHGDVVWKSEKLGTSTPVAIANQLISSIAKVM